MDKLLTLSEWAESIYGEHPPHIVTLRRWARECRIYPTPQRHGRTYYVLASARYIDPTKPVSAGRVDFKPRPGSLAERVLRDRNRG